MTPGSAAGVVLLDPTVPSFARTFDDKGFRPAWDGTTSADQVEPVTAWPDVPFEILRHDPAIYAAGKVWSDAVEMRWATDQTSFAGLAPRGTARIVPGSGHNIHQDAKGDAVAAVRRVVDAAATTPSARRNGARTALLGAAADALWLGLFGSRMGCPSFPDAAEDLDGSASSTVWVRPLGRF